MTLLKLKFEGREYAIEGQRTLVGRADSCHIVLADDSVSGFHAEILNDDGRLELIDLGSTNGTYLNDQKVESRFELSPWQRIRFGDVECEVVDASARRPTGEMPAVTDEMLERAAGQDPSCASATLVLVSEGNYPQQVFIEGRLLVGRAPECDLRLNDEMISGRHARLNYVDGRFELTDLGSTNGSYVNGSRIDRNMLRHGDRIRFDEIEYRFLVPKEDFIKTSNSPINGGQPFAAGEQDQDNSDELSAAGPDEFPNLTSTDSETDISKLAETSDSQTTTADGSEEHNTIVKNEEPRQAPIESLEHEVDLPGDERIEENVEVVSSASSEQPDVSDAARRPPESPETDLKVDEDRFADEMAGCQAEALGAEALSASQDSGGMPPSSPGSGSNIHSENSDPEPGPVHPLDRAWSFIWGRNILRPSIRILRWLIILGTLVAALVLFVDVVMPAWPRNPVLGMVLFVSLALVLWLMFALAMVVPDLIHLVIRIEQSCALPTGSGLASRYPALRAWIGWLRLLALAWMGVILANLVILPMSNAFSDSLSASASDLTKSWLVGLGIAGAVVTGGYQFWRRISKGGWILGLSRLGLLPILWLAVGLSAALMWYEGLFYLAVSLMSSVWLVAGIHALVSVISAPRSMMLVKVWRWSAVLFLVIWLMLLRAEMLQNLNYIPGVAVRLLGDEATMGSLIQMLRELAGGGGFRWAVTQQYFDLQGAIQLSSSVVIIALAVIILFRAYFYWLGSDFLRSLTRASDGLVLRLGHSGCGGIHARFVTQSMGIVTILALVTLVTLLYNAPRTIHEPWYVNLTSEFHAGVPSTMVGLAAITAYTLVIAWSLRDLLLASYDLRDAAKRVTYGQKPMDLTSLRVVYGLGMFSAFIGGLAGLLFAGRFLISALDRGGIEHFAVALAILAGTALAILLVTLPLMILRNLLDIEARTRPERASAFTVSATYPGLSTVAGIGKVMAVLVAIVATLGTTALVVFAGFANELGLMVIVGAVGLFTTFILYWLFSLIPDMIRLLLSLERNLCDPRGSVQQFLAAEMRPEISTNSTP
ncbi:MAG: FHA domain-containing protein [Wenzhouxiangella sp.]